MISAATPKAIAQTENPEIKDTNLSLRLLRKYRKPINKGRFFSMTRLNLKASVQTTLKRYSL
jgi:hypothetical protein